MIQQTIRNKDRVRTTIDLGPLLPKGSVGVVTEISTQYINSPSEMPSITVVFPQLLAPKVQWANVEGLDPDSVPHMNAVAMRPSELEVIDNLDTSGGA